MSTNTIVLNTKFIIIIKKSQFQNMTNGISSYNYNLSYFDYIACMYRIELAVIIDS